MENNDESGREVKKICNVRQIMMEVVIGVNRVVTSLQ